MYHILQETQAMEKGVDKVIAIDSGDWVTQEPKYQCESVSPLSYGTGAPLTPDTLSRSKLSAFALTSHKY